MITSHEFILQLDKIIAIIKSAKIYIIFKNLQLSIKTLELNVIFLRLIYDWKEIKNQIFINFYLLLYFVRTEKSVKRYQNLHADNTKLKN